MALTDEQREIWDNAVSNQRSLGDFVMPFGGILVAIADHLAAVEAELTAEKAMVAAAVEAQQGLEAALAADRAKVVAARVLLQAASDSLDSGRDIYTVRMGIDHFLRQTADPS